jgi:hypothetical protein
MSSSNAGLSSAIRSHLVSPDLAPRLGSSGPGSRSRELEAAAATTWMKVWPGTGNLPEYRRYTAEEMSVSPVGQASKLPFSSSDDPEAAEPSRGLQVLRRAVGYRSGLSLKRVDNAS